VLSLTTKLEGDTLEKIFVQPASGRSSRFERRMFIVLIMFVINSNHKNVYTPAYVMEFMYGYVQLLTHLTVVLSTYRAVL